MLVCGDAPDELVDQAVAAPQVWGVPRVDADDVAACCLGNPVEPGEVMLAVMVTGSRDWTERTIIRMELARYAEHPEKVLIHGDAKGADRTAAQIADSLGYHLMSCPADWKRHGKAAGPIRNREMLDCKPDVVLAFQRNGSRGTQDAINEALRRGHSVIRWATDGDYNTARRSELTATNQNR